MFHLVKEGIRRVNFEKLGNQDPSLRSENQKGNHSHQNAGTRNIAQKISNNNNNNKKYLYI